jgi:hypothetical protein
MSVKLSPVGGAAAQFFDDNGQPLSGGKLFTYAAGTTTPQETYTNFLGNTLHSNPIILDASARIEGEGEIWLDTGKTYKFILKDSNDVLIATYDNIPGINDVDASSIEVEYRNIEVSVQQALDEISDEIDVLQAEVSKDTKINYNWMGFFRTWQNGDAFRVGEFQRNLGASGATFARVNFVDNSVTCLHVKGVYQPDGIRIQRDATTASTEAVTMVMNLTQAETRPLVGKNVCVQFHALKSAVWTGLQINGRIQYSKEPQQPIVRSDGAYTNGNTILAQENFTLNATMPPENAPFFLTGMLPADAKQIAIVLTVPWVGIAPANDFVDFEGVFLTVGTEPEKVRQDSFANLLVNAQTRYQSSYGYAIAQGSPTKAGSIKATAINSDPATAVIVNVRFSPPMILTPQVLLNNTLTGTENRWLNETTGLSVNGLLYNLSNTGVTAQSNGVVTAGDVLLGQWTAKVVF